MGEQKQVISETKNPLDVINGGGGISLIKNLGEFINK